MLVKSISLANFRNHENYHLDCNPTTTLILGPNGCGKTSILEAIYMLTNGKSFRATDPEILKKGANFYRAELAFDTGQTTVATFNGVTKSFIAGDRKTTRLPAQFKYPTVFFEPSDLNFITGAPASRRSYFDRFFTQFSPKYSAALSRYEKAVRQRNELLKSDNLAPGAIDPWNRIISELGTQLSQFRAHYVSVINKYLPATYHSIAENSDAVALQYVTELTTPTPEFFYQQLVASYEKDRFAGRTTFSVQHDDYRFIFNQQKAQGSASRGESRSLIIALKFIESNILARETHLKPIILLDDVFSELDESRRACLVNNFKDHQVIITSVEETPPLD